MNIRQRWEKLNIVAVGRLKRETNRLNKWLQKYVIRFLVHSL